MDKIINKILNKTRISIEDCLYLYNNSSLSQLGFLANNIKEEINGKNIYYIHNYHIEPTNICVYNCKFCSFSAKKYSEGWEKTEKDIIEEVNALSPKIRELHIVGGANPKYNLNFYSKLLAKIKSIRPEIHIKAFTAAEIEYMSKLNSISYIDVLKTLKDSGLNSIPGGGAEILDDNIRKEICKEKLNSQRWIDIHNSAHKLGITSNATILYGHIESLRNRFEHLNLIRNLQDETNGFQTFIPLKYKTKNNNLNIDKETNIIEDLKMFALSRIFLDNFKHIKIYWPAFGKNFAQLAINFGADDLDGTISNSTKIYSMAGADELNPNMTEEEAINIIKITGNNPIERNSLYEIL